MAIHVNSVEQAPILSPRQRKEFWDSRQRRDACVRQIYNMALNRNGSAARLLDQVRRQLAGDPVIFLISEADAKLRTRNDRLWNGRLWREAAGRIMIDLECPVLGEEQTRDGWSLPSDFDPTQTSADARLITDSRHASSRCRLSARAYHRPRWSRASRIGALET
jgi:hypothetical protein